MGALASLWRIKGSVPVPSEADDNGLISRLVGIFEDFNYNVASYRDDGIVFTQPWWFASRPWWLMDDKDPHEIGPFDASEIKRKGIKGRRVLHYEFSLVEDIPVLAFEGVSANAMFAWILPEIVGIPSTVLAGAAATAMLFVIHHFRLRRGVQKAFERAFET